MFIFRNPIVIRFWSLYKLFPGGWNGDVESNSWIQLVAVKALCGGVAFFRGGITFVFIFHLTIPGVQFILVGRIVQFN